MNDDAYSYCSAGCRNVYQFPTFICPRCNEKTETRLLSEYLKRKLAEVAALPKPQGQP